MIRNRLILSSLALLLAISLGASNLWTLSFEYEEKIDTREVENEELRKEKENEHKTDWLKVFGSSQEATSSNQFNHLVNRTTLRQASWLGNAYLSVRPELFLLHCSLKIPSC